MKARSDIVGKKDYFSQLNLLIRRSKKSQYKNREMSQKQRLYCNRSRTYLTRQEKEKVHFFQ